MPTLIARGANEMRAGSQGETDRDQLRQGLQAAGAIVIAEVGQRSRREDGHVARV